MGYGQVAENILPSFGDRPFATKRLNTSSVMAYRSTARSKKNNKKPCMDKLGSFALKPSLRRINNAQLFEEKN